MKKNILTTAILMFVLGFQTGFSQKTADLFMTKMMKRTYINHTRDNSGAPGKNYWQNFADYKIKAELIPAERRINGVETIVYSNNSPDSLSRLYFNLYQDIYKKGTARDWDIGSIDITNGVEIKWLIINNDTVDINKRVSRRASIMIVRLLDKVSPHSQVEVKIKWSLILPGTRNIRMGTYDSTNFMVGYWYPRIAVYDDIYGWQKIPFKGDCEFYNDFSNYDVEITVPDKFVVLSTGLLQNEKEVFSKENLKRQQKAYFGDEVVHVLTKEDREKGGYLTKGEAHLWHFKIDSVTDFAFAASDTYLWDATLIGVENRRVRINSFYKESSKDFALVADIARKTIDYFSNQTPAIPYPFPQLTAFNGHGGMEYPGMVNDGDAETLTETLFVTSHEIGHSYFPFFTGLNEQYYAWMDEGLITLFPREIIAKYTDDTGYVLFADIVESYNYFAGSFMEMPLMIPSVNTGEAYRYQAYSHSSMAFYVLREYLGKEKFNEGLRLFAKRWQGKHPTPYDFFNTYNEVAGEDLGWLWKPWFFDLGYADLTLTKMNERGFIIENKGGLPVPVHLTIEFKDGRIEHFNQPASMWKEGKKTLAIQFNEWEIKKLILDTKLTPDAYPKDNVLVTE